MDDPREGLFQNLDIPSLEIRKFPTFIFLCGGPNPVGFPPFRSARHYVASRLNIDDVRFQAAEDIKDWFKFDAYRNLLEFEEDIAEISKVIVLFVEGPGSLVELGAFVKSETISPKLLVFIQSKYQREDSYINLGPEQYLEERHEGSVAYYKWEFDENEELIVASIEDECELIIDDIKKRLGRRVGTLPDRTSKAFRFLMIRDLIYLFHALEVSEIQYYLSKARVTIELREVKQALFCLERLDLVAKHKYGGMTCFLATGESRDLFLSYETLDKSKFDSAELQMNVAKYYRLKDKKRTRLIASFEDEVGDE